MNATSHYSISNAAGVPEEMATGCTATSQIYALHNWEPSDWNWVSLAWMERRPQRTPIEMFEDAVVDLRNQAGLVIPLEARTGYRELAWGDLGLRVYASIWPIESDPNLSEWVLLLLLATQTDSNLPLGTQLQVRDESQILQAPVLMDPQQDYLYAQVIGEYNEPFHVSIGFSDGSAISLPALTFAS
ncbi:MAG: hypothetical protein ACFBSC_09275 [Microcoleaceae cyanobacterium]